MKTIARLSQGKGMRIGFGGIGKGYAAEKAKSLLQKRSKGVIVNAVVILCVGYQPNGNFGLLASLIQCPRHACLL